MKKAFLILTVIFITAGVFAQSSAYTKYVKQAKDYEAKKQWAFALNAWYDALGCDDAPALKTEALNGYKKLSEAIYDGNPGYGNYKVSALHDEWMKLLIDAEKLGNTIFTYELTLGKLEKQSGTSNYTAKIEFKESDRYLKTIGVIAKGCAFASDLTFYDNSRWGEAWPEWPLSSASWIDSAKEIPKNLAYNIDGVKIFEVPAEYAEKVSYHDSRSSSEFFYGYHFNSFAPYSSGLRVGLYDYKFNIVDNKGKELFKGKRWLLGDGDGITLTDIPADVAKLIDSGKAFLNPVAVYLQYGKYNPADDKGGRTFIKNFPEAQLDMSTAVIYCWNKTEDKIKKNFDEALFESKKGALTSYDFIPIKGKNFEIGKTEVTQKFYEAVMGSNPSYHKGENLPVEGTSWYDAIYFCNELSRLSGFTPVYSVNGETDVKKWDYVPHKGKSLKGEIDYNPYADGYRLPTLEEWMYAAKGGENYAYVGSSNIFEVSWNLYNSGGETHPVAQKKPNGYGLYDMNGNVSEWVWDESPDESTFMGVQWNYTVSGAFHSRWAIYDVLAVESSSHGLYGESDVGLRPVRSINIKVEPLDVKKALKSYEFAFLSDVGFEIGKTEVTQQLYEAVMGKNPSWIKGANLPVEYVSWYDAIYFCNEYSRLSGFTPVYSVNGETDVKKWNYIPHSGNAIEGEIVQINSADGYRLPTSEEWLYAAKGGQNYDYSGSYNLDEVGWYLYSEKHPVAQKKPNGYGLYDMSGNVQEWVWTTSKQKNVYGGYWDKSEREVSYNESYDGASKNSGIGFRVIRLPDAGLKNTSASEIKRIINSYELAAIPGKNYEIGKTEVTQALYKAVTGDNPSWWVKDELPVERVSWYDAIYFCNELSRLTGKTPVYSVNGESDVTKWNYIPNSGQSINATINQNKEADGYRLPTLEEWVFAAKGGEKYTYIGSDRLDEVGWYKDNSGNKAHPVAQKKPNGYGLYDMSGNVWEWIWDATKNGFRHRCGGAWNTSAEYSQVSKQDSYYASNYSDGFGFRVARGKQKPYELIGIPGKDYEIGKTEVTQAVYESVMGENPSQSKGENLPVENLSFYDMLYFCNEYSRLSGLTPVYAVDGETNVKKWNYVLHKGVKLKGKITMDETANGYRLPTLEEWQYAAKGGQNYKYSGSDNIDEVAWHSENCNETIHPVAQKKANGYGLYDMSGNVMECVWNKLDRWAISYGLGGSIDSNTKYSKRLEVTDQSYVYDVSKCEWLLGFRIARNKDGIETGKTTVKTTVKSVEDAKPVEGVKNTVKPVEDAKPVEELIPAPDREAKPDSLIAIPGKNYEIGNTEVTQALYESVMGENPSQSKGENLPVESLSYYDMLYFCNEYSRLSGLTPVYAVDSKNDVKKWNYTPHKGESLKGTITMDEKANGYRLPTFEEWEYAAKGGQNFTYSGSDNIDEVAWHWENFGGKMHPVAQKLPNRYGLYDMSGNVEEWVWGDRYGRELSYGHALGGAVNLNTTFFEVKDLSSRLIDKSKCEWNRGFRLARNKDGIEIGKITLKPVEDVKPVEELIPVPDREAKPSELIAIPDKNFEIGKTEVTQALYESVMGENPSNRKGENLPVERVSWYDALYFCNEYSRLSGLTPVYAVDDETDVRKWNYNPHKGEYLKGKITMDETANGYRLPTLDEWQYAAKGGESYKYSGSDNLNEVAWYFENSELTTHPVAQKKTNGYGLYDMSGNVMECVWYRQYGRETGIGIALGGTVYMQIRYFEVTGESDVYSKFERVWGRGFRLARNKN